MKIASFNINNINRRLSNLLDWLREAEPDIVCLQELKVADSEFPAEAIRQAGYHAVYRGETSWNGVATGVAFPSLPLVIPEGVHRLWDGAREWRRSSLAREGLDTLRGSWAAEGR